MERAFKPAIALTAAFVIAVLLLDRSGIVTQGLLGLATAACAWLLCRRFRIPGAQIVCCVLVATAGEGVLSVGWGLYSYQFALIPLYVPPGHGLMYALAVATSRQPLLQQYEQAITRTALVLGTLLAVVSLLWHGDTWGLLWWIGAAALILVSRSRLLLSACLTYTMALEWAGTWNGNWRWAAEVPFLGLTSANPPSGVGILYVVLDLIVVAITAVMVERGPLRPPTIDEPAAEAAAAPL